MVRFILHYYFTQKLRCVFSKYSVASSWTGVEVADRNGDLITESMLNEIVLCFQGVDVILEKQGVLR